MTVLCNCCSSAASPWKYADQFLRNPLYMCPECRHIQIAVIPSSEAIRDYYGTTYSESRGEQVGKAYARIMRKRAAAQIDFIRRSIEVAGVAVCDVGCGYGFLLDSLGRYTNNAWGVDFDPASVNYCARKGLRVDLIEAEADLRSLPETELITLSHCVEHLAQPHETLSALARRAGHVFIEIPVYDAESRAQFEDLEGHMNFFNRNSFRLFLEKCGLEIISFTPCGPGISLFYGERWRFFRSVARRLTGDLFMGMYRLPREDGIWIRAMVRVKT